MSAVRLASSGSFSSSESSLSSCRASIPARREFASGAGLYSAFATGGPVEAAAGEIDREDLIDRSIATEDEHAIKFTEACLRENMIRPDPVYVAAAAHAAEFLRGEN